MKDNKNRLIIKQFPFQKFFAVTQFFFLLHKNRIPFTQIVHSAHPKNIIYPPSDIIRNSTSYIFNNGPLCGIIKFATQEHGEKSAIFPHYRRKSL